MSVFRLEIDIAFKTEENMVAFLNLLESMDKDMAPIQIGDLMINKKVRYHECMHDEGKPCSGYVNVEFDGKTIHEKKDGTIIEAEVIVPKKVKDKIKDAIPIVLPTE